MGKLEPGAGLKVAVYDSSCWDALQQYLVETKADMFGQEHHRVKDSFMMQKPAWSSTGGEQSWGQHRARTGSMPPVVMIVARSHLDSMLG